MWETTGDMALSRDSWHAPDRSLLAVGEWPTEPSAEHRPTQGDVRLWRNGVSFPVLVSLTSADGVGIAYGATGGEPGAAVSVTDGVGTR